MNASISEIVGRAEDVQGKEVLVYRTLRSLLCSRCGSEIKEGDLFTRGKLAGVRISPFCRECVPFQSVTTNNSDSPLIQFLLKPGTAIGKITETSSPMDNRLVSKEVERRLGPALARCRKRKQ